MVYALLSDEMAAEGGIHALQLRTMTPEEELKHHQRMQKLQEAKAQAQAQAQDLAIAQLSRDGGGSNDEDVPASA